MKALLLILIGAVLAIAGACAAWRYSPLTTHAMDATAVMAAAAEPDVRELVRDLAREAGAVYVSPPEVASALRIDAGLKASSVRPRDPRCDEARASAAAAGACDRAHHVQVVIQSIPMGRLALVQVGTHHASQEKLLVKLGDRWKIVATRGYVL
jgi:hypothetical protein